MPESPNPFEAIRLRFLQRLEEQRLILEQLSHFAGRNSEVQAIAHKIAGLAGSLGYSELSAAAADVEMLLVHDPSAGLHGAPRFVRLMEQIGTDLEKR